MNNMSTFIQGLREQIGGHSSYPLVGALEYVKRHAESPAEEVVPATMADGDDCDPWGSHKQCGPELICVPKPYFGLPIDVHPPPRVLPLVLPATEYGHCKAFEWACKLQCGRVNDKDRLIINGLEVVFIHPDDWYENCEANCAKNYRAQW